MDVVKLIFSGIIIFLFIGGNAIFAYGLYCAATHITIATVLFGFFTFVVGCVLVLVSLYLLNVYCEIT